VRRALRVVMLCFALLLAACAATTSGGAEEAATMGEARVSRVSGDLTVFAAASLTDAFREVAAAFTAEHPAVNVVFNFAGSQRLAGQIIQGAPADVFASASTGQMDMVVEVGLAAGEPQEFTGNLLEIAVEPGNPLGIAGLDDLSRPDITLVLAAPEVPAGRYAAEALDAAGVQVSPASLEHDVRAVLSKVELGEADAGVVYRSDIAAAGSVDGVEIAAEDNVPASYPIVTLIDAPNPVAAQAYVAFVLSEEGQDILARGGLTRS
jgi:molybdate transport system substrate-binding protein